MVQNSKSGILRQKDGMERLRRLEGRHNPLIKALRQAFAHSELTRDGYCAIEGAHIVDEAIRSGLRFKAVFFSESAANRAHKLLPQLGSRVEAVLLPDSLFRSAVPSETPQGVAALVQWKESSFTEILSKSASGPLIAVAGIQDPGNLGTILRSAEAFGAAGLIVTEGTVSLCNSKVIRASAGSVFRMPAASASLPEAVAGLRKSGIRLIATSSHKGIPLPQAEFAVPLCVFIGNEGSGLRREVLSQMDEIVAIPHSMAVESLNAGVAASIVLYEMARRRI